MRLTAIWGVVRMETSDPTARGPTGSENGSTDLILPEKYTTGPDRYITFVQDFFGITPTAIQRRLHRAVAENKRVLAVGANGPGKSHTAAQINGAFLYTNPDSICMPTSGTYSVLNDTLWKPLKSMVTHARRQHNLPGRTLQNPPRIQVDDEWYFKAVSPTHPENLEGRHAGTMLITIEEADKPDISHAHLDSAESMITDDNDRLLVIANPPKDEANVVYELMESNSWEVIQFSSFESRNVKIDAGESTSDHQQKVPGLVDLETVKDDWERWNTTEWPGVEAAKHAHRTNDSLDQRWYRRRAGVIPPQAASIYRPFDVLTVEAAFERTTEALNTVPSTDGHQPEGLGFDVARMGGDMNAVAGVFEAVDPSRLRILDTWQGVDHTANEAHIREQLGEGWDVTLSIDALGEGSGLSDRISTVYSDTYRFNAGGEAIEASQFYDCWSEGLHHLGQFLETGTFTNRRLREELLAAARAVEYEEQYYASRESTVLKATSKSEVRETLGRSPDLLDAALMAVWTERVDPLHSELPTAIPSTW